MIYFILALLVAIAVELVIARLNMRQMMREHSRERQLLINQILHLSGNTWQPPPIAETPSEIPSEIPVLLTSPEQLPDY